MFGRAQTSRLVACAAPILLAACSAAAIAPGSIPSGGSSGGGLPLRAASGTKYYGCPNFRGGHYYVNNITSASIDPHSANYVNSVIQAGDTYGFYASTGYEMVNLANNNTPLLVVHPQVKYHQFPVPYPWASSFFIEPLSDHHAMVVQTQTCHLYESYDTTYVSGTLGAYSGANWNLKQPFQPLSPGSPSAMASGLSLFGGLVRWEDYQSGTIGHALDWAGVAHTVAESEFVAPASDTDHLPFYGTSSYQLPYGARLRLHASFSTSGWGPEATMVATAMKTYGIYLADTGSSGNGLYFSNAANGSNPWNYSDLESLGKISISDFDVIQLPQVQTVH
jgi:hypothetical protein